MLKSFFRNAGRPGAAFGGRLFLFMMNFGHQPLLLWMRDFCDIPAEGMVLDIGCGGGRNIANLLDKTPDATFYGIDISPLSVHKSRKFNRKAVARGQVVIEEGSVDKLPFDDGTFDVVTATETVYFWPEPGGKLPRGIQGVERWRTFSGLSGSG